VSLFIDPTPEQVKAASMCGAQVVELHTGTYANAERPKMKSVKHLDEIEDAARLASKLKIKVAAGHGLNLRNTRRFWPYARDRGILHRPFHCGPRGVCGL
jgi:pyridoxine 5-phosphate synthase